MLDEPTLHEMLAAAIERHHVVGATLAVFADETLTATAAGLVNADTGVEATTDALFHTGSVCKSYTATLAMMFVDEGLLDLDAPIARVLPDFRLADLQVANRVTMRHLLSHTSGIDGDYFIETGANADAVARYVASCATLVQSQPLGVTFSYCNSGYIIAGRVIEQLSGMSWDEALRQKLLQPLGLTHTVCSSDDAMRYRVAVGHHGEPGERPTVAPAWMPRWGGPAGGTLLASASDMIAFGRLHLDGHAPDGTQLVSTASVRAMQAPQVQLPDLFTLGWAEWGLGWIIYDREGRLVFGHDGGKPGSLTARLRIVPDRRVVIALLSTGGNGGALCDDIFTPLLHDLAAAETPLSPIPPAEPVQLDLAPYVGVYERAGVRIELSERDGVLHAKHILSGPLADLVPDPVSEETLIPVAKDQFLSQSGGGWEAVTFFSLPDGGRYMSSGARATPRVD